ncbi:MAG: hypothetical protein M3220_05350 [Chloroflexota bacterium]|nr:hypothetical protein [Chloroflexota bacterium]
MAEDRDVHDFLRVIADLQGASGVGEAEDVLIADRLGLPLEEVHDRLEAMALEGHLYLKKERGRGYRTWLSPEGEEMIA